MKRLLVAHDFSQGSERALLRALRLAGRNEGPVRLLHCTAGTGDRSTFQAIRTRLLGEGQLMAEEIGRPDLDLSASVASGNAAEAILAEAVEFNADLIVMGGHSAPRFRDAIFGTTATHVVRHCDRAVLVVQDVGKALYAEVMVAIEDPVTAHKLLTAALMVSPAAEIVAVHAFSPTLAQTFGGPVELEGYEKRFEQQLLATVAAVAEGKRSDEAGAHVTAVVETGEVLSVLMKAYEERRPALLALGTREDATFLGSHAVDTLFWCPGDLLVVPDHAIVRSAAAMGQPAVSRI